MYYHFCTATYSRWEYSNLSMSNILAIFFPLFFLQLYDYCIICVMHILPVCVRVQVCAHVRNPNCPQKLPFLFVNWCCARISSTLKNCCLHHLHIVCTFIFIYQIFFVQIIIMYRYFQEWFRCNLIFHIYGCKIISITVVSTCHFFHH